MRPSGIFPSLPSGMDSILKAYFDSFMEKGELPPELRQLEGVSLFNNKELLKDWRSNFKGIQWKDEEQNILKGAVDNILKKGGKLIVLDYKTRGFPLKDDTKDHYQDQLDIYNFLLRKNDYETEDYAYLAFYHPTGVNRDGSVIFHADLIKMDTDVENAGNIFTNAIKVLKGEMPESSEGCEYCKWARNSK
jgi:hypothetical protein